MGWFWSTMVPLPLELGGPRTAEFLRRCEELVPWKDLAASIAHQFPDQPNGGRPFWPAAHTTAAKRGATRRGS